jgi:hypothetical protein
VAGSQTPASFKRRNCPEGACPSHGRQNPSPIDHPRLLGENGKSYNHKPFSPSPTRERTNNTQANNSKLQHRTS